MPNRPSSMVQAAEIVNMFFSCVRSKGWARRLLLEDLIPRSFSSPGASPAPAGKKPPISGVLSSSPAQSHLQQSNYLWIQIKTISPNNQSSLAFPVIYTCQEKHPCMLQACRCGRSSPKSQQLNSSRKNKVYPGISLKSSLNKHSCVCSEYSLRGLGWVLQ